jgi:hypothetical protein
MSIIYCGECCRYADTDREEFGYNEEKSEFICEQCLEEKEDLN